MLKKLSLAASAFAVAAMLSSSTAFAGMKEVSAPVVEPPAEEDPVSGFLSLMANTHFISYGLDVWGAGMEWNDVLFNPAFGLDIALTDSLTFHVDTWWDVNDNAESSIGDSIQEIDVNVGFIYTTGPVTLSLIYGEWMYANDSERVLDFKIAVDTFLQPYILVHGRVDAGPTPDEGVVGVFGGSYGFEAGPVSFSIPAAVAFATEDYFGGDGGFAYVTTGLSASVPVTFLPGEWSASAAVNYYHTQDSVYPTNPDSDFVTGTAGMTLTF